MRRIGDYRKLTASDDLKPAVGIEDTQSTTIYPRRARGEATHRFSWSRFSGFHGASVSLRVRRLAGQLDVGNQVVRGAFEQLEGLNVSEVGKEMKEEGAAQGAPDICKAVFCSSPRLWHVPGESILAGQQCFVDRPMSPHFVRRLEVEVNNCSSVVFAGA